MTADENIEQKRRWKSKMKSTQVLAGLLIISIVTLASLSTALAQDYDYYPVLNISKGGAIWQFDTKGLFSGKDVVFWLAEYWIVDEYGETTYYPMPTPMRTQFVNNHVKLTFDSATLPAYANGTRVTGTLADSKTFKATGPGFIFGVH